MSVVNKMLQDLDARKGQAEGFSADYQPPKRPSYILWILISLTAVVAGVIAWLYFWVLDQANNPPTAAPAITIDKSAVAHKTPQPMLTLSPPVANERQIKPQTAPESLVQQGQVGEMSNILAVTERSAKIVSVPLESNQQTTLSINTSVPENLTPTTSPATFSINSASKNNSQAGLKQNISDALGSGKTLVAIEGLQRLLVNEPANLRARKKLAALLFAENRITQAKLVLQQGLSLHPVQTDLRLMLAKLLVQQDNTDGAIQLLREYSPSAVAQPDYYAYRGALAQRLALFSLAQQDYLLLSQVDSVKAKWWLGLAIAQDSQGNVQDARQSYARADDAGQLSPQVIQFVHKRINDLMGVK